MSPVQGNCASAGVDCAAVRRHLKTLAGFPAAEPGQKFIITDISGLFAEFLVWLLTVDGCDGW